MLLRLAYHHPCGTNPKPLGRVEVSRRARAMFCSEQSALNLSRDQRGCAATKRSPSSTLHRPYSGQKCMAYRPRKNAIFPARCPPLFIFLRIGGMWVELSVPMIKALNYLPSRTPSSHKSDRQLLCLAIRNVAQTQTAPFPTLRATLSAGKRHYQPRHLSTHR